MADTPEDRLALARASEILTSPSVNLRVAAREIRDLAAVSPDLTGEQGRGLRVVADHLGRAADGLEMIEARLARLEGRR